MYVEHGFVGYEWCSSFGEEGRKKGRGGSGGFIEGSVRQVGAGTAVWNRTHPVIMVGILVNCMQTSSDSSSHLDESVTFTVFPIPYLAPYSCKAYTYCTFFYKGKMNEHVQIPLLDLQH